MSVLLASSKASACRAIRSLLEEDGRFEVVAEAGDAATAVALAILHGPDLCLLEAELPGNGVAAAWEIGARLPQARLVMLAASVDERDVFSSLHAGAEGYLLTGMDTSRLVRALRDVMRGNAAIPREMTASMMQRLRHSDSRGRPPLGDVGEPGRLTSREWEILSLLRDKLTTREIANQLSLDEATVRGHRARLLRKLDQAGDIVALDFAANARRSSRGRQRSPGRASTGVEGGAG